MKNLSVCSWSYRLSARGVADEMAKCGVDRVHLAVNPFVDPSAIVPGTAGETEIVGGTGGVDPIDRQRRDVEEFLASGRWKLSSTLFNSRYDDYSSLEAIRRTGGLVPDGHWEENRALITEVAKLSAEWKSPYLMLHAGFIDRHDRTAYSKLTDRLKCVRDICADAGVGLTLETGQETAEDLAGMLSELPGVYVNFDPANMILYGKGDPVKAVKTLAPWIRHVHVKDAVSSARPGEEWGAETEWTRGQVDAPRFIAALKEIGFGGFLAVEREDGGDRAGDIARAVADLKAR
jgi:sugar phosphate isomerase/epimerase